MRKMTYNRSPLESNLVKKVEQYIKTTYRKDSWFLKTHGNGCQRSGVPDILCCIKGHFIALELKREDGSGRASPQQEIECKKINGAGGHALISDNMEEIRNFIESIVK